MKVCLVVGIILGVMYWTGYQSYRADVRSWYAENADYLQAYIKTEYQLHQYMEFTAPDLLRQRDFLRSLFWVYIGFMAVGVPKPTKDTLRCAYILLRGGSNRGET